MRKLLVLTLIFAAGCADNAARYLVDPPPAAAQVRVPVRTIEVREIVLPAYAAAVEIAGQEPGGALRNMRRAIWADDPVQGLTAALAASLDEGSTATAAAEPWPLSEPAQALVEVRVARMVAGTDGRFRMTGQYALTAPGGAISDRLRRFDIAVPMQGTDAAAVAGATGTAIGQLAQTILHDLAGR